MESMQGQKRKYFPVKMPDGKIKYIRDRISYRQAKEKSEKAII